MWDPPATLPKTVASLAIRAVIIHADLLATRSGKSYTAKLKSRFTTQAS